MRALGIVVLLVSACGGGGRTTRESPRPAATESPHVTHARNQRAEVCACKDAACATEASTRYATAPAGAQPTDPAVLRLLLELQQDTLECMYRLRGVPESCLAFYREVNKLAGCPQLTESETAQLDELLTRTTAPWADISWASLSAAEKGDLEHGCVEAAEAVRSATTACR